MYTINTQVHTNTDMQHRSARNLLVNKSPFRTLLFVQIWSPVAIASCKIYLWTIRFWKLLSKEFQIQHGPLHAISIDHWSEIPIMNYQTEPSVLWASPDFRFALFRALSSFLWWPHDFLLFCFFLRGGDIFILLLVNWSFRNLNTSKMWLLSWSTSPRLLRCLDKFQPIEWLREQRSIRS